MLHLVVALEQEVANHWQTDLVGTSHRLQVKPQSRVGKLFAQGSQINSFIISGSKTWPPD
jgi:putative glutamine amidotransferase